MLAGLSHHALKEVIHLGRCLSDDAPALLCVQWREEAVQGRHWHLTTDILMDNTCRASLAAAVIEFLEKNWCTTATRANEREAMKLVMRGVCIGSTTGICKQLEADVTQQKRELAEHEKGVADSPKVVETKHGLQDLWNALHKHIVTITGPTQRQGPVWETLGMDF
ncbi:hypothetical protein NDU88_003095 [Pleurodeles waltl]|uniref:Uncharacterized protein n=1 Tax=Pleurodeles waltl TaxID=8319 RepID=A0AAV7NIX3_PLEWA|nr:hypothetical protein NDU88_003095 [Pleurodeles waltl]